MGQKFEIVRSPWGRKKIDRNGKLFQAVQAGVAVGIAAGVFAANSVFFKENVPGKDEMIGTPGSGATVTFEPVCEPKAYYVPEDSLMEENVSNLSSVTPISELGEIYGPPVPTELPNYKEIFSAPSTC